MELAGNHTHTTEMKNNVQYTGVQKISEVKIIFHQPVCATHHMQCATQVYNPQKYA
jgi:hypothetical protein